MGEKLTIWHQLHHLKQTLWSIIWNYFVDRLQVPLMRSRWERRFMHTDIAWKGSPHLRGSYRKISVKLYRLNVEVTTAFVSLPPQELQVQPIPADVRLGTYRFPGHTRRQERSYLEDAIAAHWHKTMVAHFRGWRTRMSGVSGSLSLGQYFLSPFKAIWDSPRELQSSILTTSHSVNHPKQYLSRSIHFYELKFECRSTRNWSHEPDLFNNVHIPTTTGINCKYGEAVDVTSISSFQNIYRVYADQIHQWIL